MMDITQILKSELLQDLADSNQDILDCTIALTRGITECHGESIADRLEANRKIVKKICAELHRREEIENG